MDSQRSRLKTSRVSGTPTGAGVSLREFGPECTEKNGTIPMAVQAASEAEPGRAGFRGQQVLAGRHSIGLQPPRQPSYAPGSPTLRPRMP